MAKSRAQQAAIAISMKKAGKKPKQMKKGGKAKTLSKVSKQLAKASKMHAEQSKKVGKLAEMMQEGGYPKSDPNVFMKSMGYYQGGGMKETPMYGANVIPGSQDTSAVVYTEADPARLKQLEQELEQAQESTKYMDEAEAKIAEQQAKIEAVEGTVGTAAESLRQSGLLDRLKENIAQRAAQRGIQETAKQAGRVIGTQTAQAATSQAAPGMLRAVAPKVVTGVETVGMQAARQGTVEMAKATLPGATTSAAASGIGVPTLGTVAAVGGEVLKQASSDQDATTLNVGETAGTIVSGAGKGIGAALTAGALLGTSVGPIGTVAGAIGGAAYGLGKALFQRKKAREEMEDAERKQQEELELAQSKRKLEALKSRQYSGFDFGTDIAKYGGYYQSGGIKLPGGVAKPIPGSDAIEFKGRSHAQGGIMVDPNTEVEGNETMDKVTMKNGNKSDYFFSQYLKMGGKSFAQRHKDILKNGGRQKDIDALAKLQEKKAGRDPNTVKLGAGGYYQGGGYVNRDGELITDPITNLGSIDPLGNLILSDKNMDGYDDRGYVTDSGIRPLYSPSTEDTPAPTTTSNDSKTDSGKTDKRETVSLRTIPTRGIDATPTIPTELETIPEDQIYLQDSDKDKDKDTNSKKLKRASRKDLLTTAAQLGQLVPAAAAYFSKPDYMDEPAAVGDIKAQRLERVSFNAERAANAANARAMNRFIETSGAGPAGIIAKMSAYRRKQEGDINIAAQEARINTQIANEEARLRQQADAQNQQIRLQNIKNTMFADEFNRAADAAVEDRKLMALDNAFKALGTMNTDRLQYLAQERLGRAIEGQTGVLTREQIGTMVKDSYGLVPGSAEHKEKTNELYLQMLENQKKSQNRLGGVRKYI